MDSELLLSKCITLLYRESQLENNAENSADLVKTVLEKLKIGEVSFGIQTKRDILLNLKAMATAMANNPATHVYDLPELLQQLRINTKGDDNTYAAVAQGIEPELQGGSLKRNITNLRKSLTNYYREQRTIEVFGKAYRDLTFNRHNISDLTSYVQAALNEIQVVSTPITAKDPAIIRSVDIGDDRNMEETFNRVLENNSEELVYKFGWQELNNALQGGGRAGDCIVTGALQHKYKTGTSLSMFAHVALFNTPKTKDPTKKPLLYRVSCEDPLIQNAQFLYQLLKYEETGEKVDVKVVSPAEMSAYVKKRLQVNGFHILIDEINPQLWTYQSLINRIIELEANGYKVEFLSVDYLPKIPTTGCNQGAMGDDVMDMLSRIRAYCSANGIMFATPWQLSTEAKRQLQLMPADNFLPFIKGGGFFEKTRGLDRIYDIGILQHIVSTPAGDYLHMVLDKHRFPTVVDNVHKSWFLRFPSGNGMPIPSNINNPDHKILRKVPKMAEGQSSSNSLFDL